MSWDLIIVFGCTNARSRRGGNLFLFLWAFVWGQRAPRFFSHQRELSGQHPAALSHVSLRKKSLVHVPDFRQQRWELLVLEAEGENLLWVDTAECAQAHQLHQHAGKHQVILRRHLIQSLNRPLLRPHVCRHGDSGVPLTCRPLQQGVNCYLHLVFLSWCKSAGGRHTAAGVAPPDRDPARWVDLSKQTWLSSYLSDCRITFQTPL